MISELYLSHKVLDLPLSVVDQATNYLIGHYGTYGLPTDEDDALIDLMRNDKKNEEGKINFSLIPQPGAVAVNQTCERPLILESLDYYRACSHAASE